MKSKTITWIIFATALVLFSLMFLPRIFVDEQHRIKDRVDEISAYAQAEDWPNAQASIDSLIENWKTHKFLIAFNYAEEDFSTLDDSINRIRGAILCQDKETVVIESEAVKDLFDNATRLIPEP